MSDLLNTFVMLIHDNIPMAILVFSTIVVIMSLSISVIFYKIGDKFWKGLLPLYNIFTLLKVLDIPIWMAFVIFIPFVNIVGIPIMMLVIGKKLGTYCKKGTVLKIGLMFLPLLFYPILAMTEIDLDGNKIKLDQIVLKPIEEFKLDPVLLMNASDAPTAMSLGDLENMNKLASLKAESTNRLAAEAEAAKPKDKKEHLAKADKEMPTAQDLTFDYNLIYSDDQVETSKPITIIENIEETPEPDNNTVFNNIVDENPIITIEEVAEETEFVPVIHDIELEETSEVDESTAGVIPINRRYDKQNKKDKKKKGEELEKIEEVIVPEETLEPIEIPTQPTMTNINIPLMADAPDLTIVPSTSVVEIDIPEIVMPDTSVQYEQMVSMNIEEPDQLPVAILVKDEPVEEVVEEDVRAYLTTQPTVEIPVNPYQDIHQTIADSTAIFQTGGAEMLRPSVQQSAQIDKICPSCGVKLKRDSGACFMCGHNF